LILFYDNVPPNLTIIEVFQKWAGLEIRFDGNDKKLLRFEVLVS